jgi:hypothetical protein
MMLTRLALALSSGGRARFDPRYDLFRAGEQGLWYDLNDDSTIFQDSAGTTLASWGDPVGLVLDKHDGLAQGANTVTNGTFTADITGWTLATGAGGTIAWSAGSMRVVRTTGTASGYQAMSVVAGITYKVTAQATLISGTGTGIVVIRTGVGSSDTALVVGAAAASQTVTIYYTAASTTTVYLHLGLTTANGTWDFDNVTAVTVAGNHAIQSTSGSRPIRGRMPKAGVRNLLTATATLATQNVTTTNVQHTLSFTGTGTVTLSGTSTAGPLVGTGVNDRVSLTFTPTAGTLTLTVTGSVTLAQLQTGAAFDAYQAVGVTRFDITESGQPSCGYLSFNGSNQWMQTAAAVNFSATDEMSVFAGVRKVADPANGTLIEANTPSWAAGAGTFILGAPLTTGSLLRGYAFGSRGTAAAGTDLTSNTTSASFVAPVYNVVTGLADISTDQNLLRANGAQIGSATGDQGSGNYGNYTLYFGARIGASNFLNGLMFSTIIRGALTSGTLLTRTEQYVARQTPTVNL